MMTDVEANPFVRKARERQERRDRGRTILMGHLHDLTALLKRYDAEPGPGRERVAARVEECKEALRWEDEHGN